MEFINCGEKGTELFESVRYYHQKERYAPVVLRLP